MENEFENHNKMQPAEDKPRPDIATGRILEPFKRAANVGDMYNFLERNAKTMNFEQTMLKLHDIGLSGWDLTKLRRYVEGGEVDRNYLEKAQVGNYRDD